MERSVPARVREDDRGFGDGEGLSLGGVACVREVDHPVCISLVSHRTRASSLFLWAAVDTHIPI